MYVKDYCKKCSLELTHEHLREQANKDPELNLIVEQLISNDIYMLEYKKEVNKNIRQRYKDIFISERLRAKVSTGLKSKSEIKLNIYNELIGCSINELKAHLESKFQDEMTWDNYGNGGWHIDHKKPCQDFDLTDAEEQKKCFHYKNLQPLWAMDNFFKNGKHNRRRKR